MQRIRGFTLIELVVVMVIAAILAAIAIPSFTRQLRKSHRSDAFTSIAHIQLLEEKWRGSNATYGVLAALGPASLSNSVGGYYNISVTVPPAAGVCAAVGAATPTMSSNNSYTITATATGAQAQDTGCATISLTNRCSVFLKSSTGGATCWPD